MAVKDYGASLYATTAAAASGVIKASPGILNKVIGHNDKASTQYIQLFDAAAVPSDTAVPKMVIVAAADSNFEIDLGDGASFNTGMAWSNSSTLATKTIGSADCWLNAVYR